MAEGDHEVQYRFRWTLLAEAELIFPNEGVALLRLLSRCLKGKLCMSCTKGESILTEVDSAPHRNRMSRLNMASMDHDLMKSVERIRIGNCDKLMDKRTSSQEQLCDVFGDKLHLHQEAHFSDLAECRKGCVDNQVQIKEERNEMAALGLPVEFCQRNVERKKRRGKKRKSMETSWMVGLEFDGYWDMSGEYITNQTWLNDYGSQVDENLREQFRHSTMRCKPDDLIECHRDLKGYTSIVYSTDANQEYATWEDLYSRHCELVKKRAKHDFEKQQRRSALSRCKQFLKKVRGLQFVPGCELIYLPDGTSVTGASVDSNSEVEDSFSQADEKVGEPSNKAEPPTKRLERRRLINYDDIGVFNDVYADFYSDSHATGPLVLDDSSAAHGELPCDDSREEATESSRRRPLTMKEKLDFDFGFDAERDAHLVAKNCFRTFANDPEMKKYMFQRFRLFSRFDEGVLMDRDGWFSVTPERMAQHIADRMVRREGALIIDAFTGVGGNAIQFALKGAFVIAIDLDPVRLRCAVRNARVYGIADRINFVCTDFFHFARSPRVWLPPPKGAERESEMSANDTVEKYAVDAVFLSPPWGGPSYLKMKEFDISEHLSPNGFETFRVAKGLSPNIAYFLPRQTTVSQLVSLAGPGGSCEIEQNLLNSKVKAVTAYYGDLVTGR